MSLKSVGHLKNSRAKNIIEASGSSLLTFELPGVTEQSEDFIKDEVTSEQGEHFETDENAEAEKYRGAPDDKGNAFDPAIHAYPPEMTGKLRKWKRKPKAKQQEAASDGVLSQAAYRSEADKMAQIYAQLHMLPFGQNGKLENKADLAPMIDDLTRYMEENGHRNISAGWAVAISSALYSVSVCQRKPNSEKLKGWFGGVWSTVKGWFGQSEKSEIFKPEKTPEYVAKTDKDKDGDLPNSAPYDTTDGY